MLEGEGDCDADSDCQGHLLCGNDNCNFGPSWLDCCVMTCRNDSDCLNQECIADTKQCRLDSYSTDWSKCSLDSPCGAGEGDCDEDSGCEGLLVCGIDNCANETPFMDCCEHEIYKGEKYLRIGIDDFCIILIFQNVVAF